MHTTLTIARRQFASYFNGPVAYIVLCIVLIILGIFFWNSFFLWQRATVRELFNVLKWCMLFAAPALTMGILAEEKRSGTIELLLTMPVRDSEVVFGKYLGVVGLFAVLLLLTLPYPISVSMLGPLDWQQVAAGYLGAFLMGASMLAVGLLTSSWTDNQLVAFFTSLAACGLLVIIDWFLAFVPTGLASIAEIISVGYHMESMARGVIDSRDVVYFAVVITASLMLAFRALESRRWK